MKGYIIQYTTAMEDGDTLISYHSDIYSTGNINPVYAEISTQKKKDSTIFLHKEEAEMVGNLFKKSDYLPKIISVNNE